MPERGIIEVMNDNADRIMALDDVVMVAVGQTGDGEPCIIVYVKVKSEAVLEEIGEEIEGYRVVYELSEEIRPM